MSLGVRGRKGGRGREKPKEKGTHLLFKRRKKKGCYPTYCEKEGKGKGKRSNVFLLTGGRGGKRGGLSSGKKGGD